MSSLSSTHDKIHTAREASKRIPRALLAPSRSAFSLIDPVSEDFYRVFDPSGSPSSYVAISYLWDDWKERPGDRYPSWRLLRDRLIQLATTDLARRRDVHQLAGFLPRTDFSFRCWLDSKCINQELKEDKDYWVPRMNTVYFEARCTVFLIRDLDLTALYEVAKGMKCLVAENITEGDEFECKSSHRCLFAPHCISLTSAISSEMEDACLQTLELLWSGAWRKRAWIFQEILLSERYLLCWGGSSSIAYIELQAVGRLAAFFYSRHPGLTWLHDFWSWCKQCLTLREFYADGCDMEATLLQQAENLESTLPCDKYYALSGILGLTSLKYNSEHTAEEALDNIISTLTRLGRMGWMYAIPSSVQGLGGVALSDGCMAPFFLSRKKRQFEVANFQEGFVSDHFVGFPAVDLGTVCKILSIEDLVRNMGDYLWRLSDGRIHSPGFRVSALRGLYHEATPVEKQLPHILFRLGYDTVRPWCERGSFRRLWRALRYQKENLNLWDEDGAAQAMWLLFVTLLFVDADSFINADPAQEQLLRTTASEFQGLLRSIIRQNWHAVLWQPRTDGRGGIQSQDKVRLALASIADAHLHVQSPESESLAHPWMGRTVWGVRTRESNDSITVVADQAARYQSLTKNSGVDLLEPSANFFGVALQVPRHLTLVDEPSRIPYHDNPVEGVGNIIQQTLTGFLNALSTTKRSLEDSLGNRVKVLLAPRHKAAAGTTRRASREWTRWSVERWMDLRIGLFQHAMPSHLEQGNVRLEDGRPPLNESAGKLSEIFPQIQSEILLDVLAAHNQRGLQPNAARVSAKKKSTVATRRESIVGPLTQQQLSSAWI